MRRLRLAPFVVLAALAAACAESPAVQQSGDLIYEARATASGGVIDVIASRSHAVVRTLPLGAASPDWKHLYSVVSTSLVDTDPVTGATLRTMRLGGAYRMPAVTASGLPGGLSPNGAWLVVESIDRTNMLVVDTSTWQLRRKLELAGDFHFDAVSNDGDRVYLIQYVAGKEYFVRLYDVDAGALIRDPVVDKSEGGEAMTGVRVTGVPSSGGEWLYSMYVRDHSSPFLHVLNLDGPYALCLDLPGSGFGDDAQGTRWTLAMDSTGEHLYATNAATGVIVQLDARGDSGPAIVRQARLDPLPAAARDAEAQGALVAGDSLIVAAGSGVVWIDTRTLTVRHIALEDWAVTSLVAAAGGKTLYAVNRDGRIAELAGDTGALRSTFDPRLDRPLALLRVAPA